MKKRNFLVFLITIMLSCTQNNKNSGSTVTERNKKQIMDIAVDYAREKFIDVSVFMTPPVTSLHAASFAPATSLCTGMIWWFYE